MMSNLPDTMHSLCDFLVEHADRIYVYEDATEEHPDIRWTLAELPGPLAVKWTTYFVKAGRMPYRLLTDEEVEERRG